MSYNRKTLSKAKLDLDKYKKPNPYKKDILYTQEGQWKYPGQKTRIPSSDITMQGVPFPVFAQPNVGQPQMMYPGQEYSFPGASYVDEYPQMKKGGLVQMPKPSKKGLASKKYSRSLSATNKLFTENPLFKKPKSKKRKVFDPNAKYYQDGGITLPNDYIKFKAFTETLPSNLQDPNFEYGNPDQYNLYGMWETVGKPNSFAEVQDSEYFPLQDDGTYHGFTVGSDGEFLKPMSHGTTWKEVMNAHLNTDPYFQQNRIIKNEKGRLQYIPNNEDDYIELDLSPKEIEQYAKGGYVVEELPEMQPGGPFKPGTGYKMPALSKSEIAAIKKEVSKAKPVTTKKPVAKKPSTSSFADRAAQVDKENKLKGIENISVDEATWNANRDRQNMQHLSEALSGVGEITGINSAIRTGERLIDDPLKFADDLTTGISQAPETLVEGAMTLGSKLFGDNKDYVDVDTDALGVALDVAGSLPVVGTAGKVAKPVLKTGLKYLTTGPLRNAYKINPFALKENPEMFLYRTQPKDFVAGYTEEQQLKDLITDKILKGEKVPFYLQGKLNKIKYQPEPFRKALDKYHGQWFDKNPERMDFYMKDRLDGDEGNILRLKVPKEEGLSYNLKNFPEAQKASLNYDTEFIVPRNKINESEIFGTKDWQQLVQEDKAFNTPHWLRGYKEVPKNKKGGNINNYAPGGELSPKDLDPVTLEKYLSDLRGLENSIKKGYKNNKWYPHSSIEGGANTIAYGHKLQPGESFSSGLTEQQARDLQKKDVLAHQTKAEKFVDDKYGKGTYDKLPQNSQMLLTDYAYNLGSLNKFPSFVEGVVKGDKNKMLQQYERRGLNERNKWTKDVINTTDFSEDSDYGFNWMFDLDGWWNKKNGGAIELKIKNDKDLKRLIDQGYIIEEL